MKESIFINEFISFSAFKNPDAPALTHADVTISYAELDEVTQKFSSGLLGLGISRGERIAVYLEKRFETVVASFSSSVCGAVFVPVNPVLKPDQVAFILRDCQVRILVTSPERMRILKSFLVECPDLLHVVLTGSELHPSGYDFDTDRIHLIDWASMLNFPIRYGHRVIDSDMAAILYTSGSTGLPKGVVLSHRNLVAGAKSVASYLENDSDDTLLAALPLSFDAGFSQLTTAFHVGARVVLLNYLVPRDVLNIMAKECVTGLTAVPPLYIQLSHMEWPDGIAASLRYFANTGGHLPQAALKALRQKLPNSKPFLMYGLTEAFRSTYLPPDEIDNRPDSIGRAIPNAEILVLREDGSICSHDEPGELVHRGALVGMGYWNDAEKTAERYKLLPVGAPGRPGGLKLPEYAVFSGDTVRRDLDGFLYFLGRRDDMIKTSGYRVSPTEVEDILYATRLVGECIAFGVVHPSLGHEIQVVATGIQGLDEFSVNSLLQVCRLKMPAYMLPAGIEQVPGPLPRNQNGKIDRSLLVREWYQRKFGGINA